MTEWVPHEKDFIVHPIFQAVIPFRQCNLFGDLPSCTEWAECDTDVGDAQTICQDFCRVNI